MVVLSPANDRVGSVRLQPIHELLENSSSRHQPRNFARRLQLRAERSLDCCENSDADPVDECIIFRSCCLILRNASHLSRYLT